MKKILNWFMTFNWMAFILSFAIAVPLLFRPFYYIHIDAMKMVEQTGYSKEEIKDAYDEMMDFCVFGKPFGTGVLKYSQEGQSHFEDVAILFRLDFIVLIISVAVFGLIRILKLRPEISRHSPRYLGSCGLLIFATVLFVIFAIDFDKAFITFHHIFFPGKTNWIFDPSKDEIIRILPEEFFRNCAILILAIMFGLCAYFIVTENRKLKKTKNSV